MALMPTGNGGRVLRNEAAIMIDEEFLMGFADPASMAFWAEDKVRYKDLDTNGHINNAVYPVFMETARVEFRASMMARLPDDHFGSWVIGTAAIKFLKPGHYPGNVRVGIAPQHVGRTSFTLGYGIFQAGTCIAVAGARSVQLDRDTGLPAPLPEAFRSAMTDIIEGRALPFSA
jgi:acyl-CoA thioester hydrolase